MMPGRSHLLGAVVFVLVCWAVALVSALAGRASTSPLCVQDRVELQHWYQVDVDLRGGGTRSLCNVTCARLFVEKAGGKAVRVTVRDETSGERIDSESAFYVESRVHTHRESANRIHVFADAADAREHADRYGGTLTASPFAGLLQP